MTESQAINNIQAIASTLEDPDRSALYGSLNPFIHDLSNEQKADALEDMNVLYWAYPSSTFASSIECLGDTVNPDIKYPKGLG